MKKTQTGIKTGIIFLALIAALFVFSAGCTGEVPADTPGAVQTETVPAATETQNTETESLMIGEDELIDLIHDAAQYVRDNGEDKAFSEFNKKEGIFSKEELYIYAYDFNGTLLAHPYQPDKIGTDRSEWTTSNGLKFVQAATDVAETGEGFIMYMYPSPGSGEINESEKSSYIPKIGYVEKVNDNLWIGSGIYLKDYVDRETGAMPAIIEEMGELVESTVDFARENGDEAAFAEIDKKEGQFTKGDLYIYAYDFNGTMLAHPYMTEKIGTNLMDHVGPYGVQTIKVLSENAEDNGGIVVFGWENPENENKPELKLGYVKPVNDEWWVGSGVYLSELH